MFSCVRPLPSNLQQDVTRRHPMEKHAYRCQFHCQLHRKSEVYIHRALIHYSHYNHSHFHLRWDSALVSLQILVYSYVACHCTLRWVVRVVNIAKSTPVTVSPRAVSKFHILCYACNWLFLKFSTSPLGHRLRIYHTSLLHLESHSMPFADLKLY